MWVDVDEELYDDLYRACLSAVKQLGPDIRKMSWFGQWSREGEQNFWEID